MRLPSDLRVREVELHQRVRAAQRRREGHSPLVLADRVVRERQPAQPQRPSALAQQRTERCGAARADGAAVELERGEARGEQAQRVDEALLRGLVELRLR